jgi:ribosome maturation factor RimP
MDLERIRSIAERVAGAEGLELLAAEWAGPDRGGVLRLIIDRPQGGVSHRDCQAVSEQVGAILDVEDLVPGRYTLEVASPGLDRKLYSPADFVRFRGRRVKVRLKQPLAELGGRRFEAELEGLAEGVVSFQVEGRRVSVPYDGIEAVNLKVDL